MTKRKTGFERRSPNRTPDPPCPLCETPGGAHHVTARTAFVFFKCSKCGHVWEMQMPKDYRLRYIDQKKKS